MKRKYIWTCDYCGKEFGTKKLCDSHELRCTERNVKNLLYFWIACVDCLLFYLLLTNKINGSSSITSFFAVAILSSIGAGFLTLLLTFTRIVWNKITIWISQKIPQRSTKFIHSNILKVGNNITKRVFKTSRIILISSFIILFFVSLARALNYSLEKGIPQPIQFSTPTPTLYIDDEKLLDFINGIRSSKNISVLKKSDNLCKFTEERLEYLSNHEKEVADYKGSSMLGLSEMKKDYSGNRVGELLFGHVKDMEDAQSLITSDSNGDQFLLITKKDTNVMNVACVKSKQGPNSFWVLVQLGSETLKSVVSNKTENISNEPTEWGKAVQIDEHTWTMKTGGDSKMASPEEILQALNDYRRNHGSQILTMDSKLSDYAQTRADYFYSIKSLDGHKGFNNFLDNEDGYHKLGYNWLGENDSIGYKLNGVHLIEWVYAGDDPHNKNQLDIKWDHVGIAVKGTATCLIFGTAKL